MSKVIDDLLKKAWEAREFAYPWKSGMKVGCAILCKEFGIVTGFNVEGLWMTSIHAEVCAVAELIRTGQKGIAVAIVADAESFTPCGACLDWLFQFCGHNSLVVIQNKKMETKRFTLKELCPHYPVQ